jgi:hypothetical protein
VNQQRYRTCFDAIDLPRGSADAATRNLCTAVSVVGLNCRTGVGLAAARKPAAAPREPLLAPLEPGRYPVSDTGSRECRRA